MEASKTWLKLHKEYLQKPTKEKMEKLIDLLQAISSFRELERIYLHLVPESRLEIETRKRMEQIIINLNLHKEFPAWFMFGIMRGLYFSRWSATRNKITKYITEVITEVFNCAAKARKETGFFEISFTDMHTQFAVLTVEPVFGFVRAEEETDVHKKIRRLLELIPVILRQKLSVDVLEENIFGWFGGYYIEGKLSSAGNLNYLLVYQNLELLITKKEAELVMTERKLEQLKQVVQAAKEKQKK